MRTQLILLSLLTSLTVKAQTYDCKISHTLVRPDGRIDANWHVFIKENSGIIKLDGMLHDDKKGDSIISRQIFFDVEKFSLQGYHLSSRRIKKNPVENVNNEKMANYYPDFFLYENRKTMFTITRSGNNSIMSWATDPMFSCN